MTKQTRLPHGCDQQGRYPEAAEPCTELGQEDDPDFYGAKFWEGEIIAALCVAAASVAGLAVLAMIFGA
jgi:hypothetical protein